MVVLENRFLLKGDVVVRLCRDGIFTEGEVCRKTHDTQSLRCISLNWRRSMNHVLDLKRLRMIDRYRTFARRKDLLHRHL